MSAAARYLIPAGAIEVITEIKRSRFAAYIAHSHNAASALAIIAQQKKQHPDARHHCWAFIACSPLSASAIRFSDDGEPSGTAGKPILNVLHYSHYGEIICVVSRYFGGIKLGAGGLLRAYSNSTQAALEQLPVKEIVELEKVNIQFAYPFESSMRRYLKNQHIVINQVAYHDIVVFQLDIEKNQRPQLTRYACDLCKGQVLITSETNK